jgi:hypothetical protein
MAPVNPAPSTFDAALATAFGHDSAEAPGPARLPVAEPAPKFRIAENPDVVRVRAGGPVVELEASMVRGLEPIAPAPAAENGESDGDGSEPASKPNRTPESQAFRRTAMAELTALAGDSDDLTPRRRR